VTETIPGQATLECSQPSPIMPLRHICKVTHFLSSVPFMQIMPSICPILRTFDSENFYLLVYCCFNYVLLCLGKSRQELS